MRVGFVGEWGFEIHVAAEHGPALWTRDESGERHGIGLSASRRSGCCGWKKGT